MDLTAPSIPDEEIYESPEIIDQKAQLLADLIRKSKHFIAFTGAGVSTSAGMTPFLLTYSLCGTRMVISANSG